MIRMTIRINNLCVMFLTGSRWWEKLLSLFVDKTSERRASVHLFLWKLEGNVSGPTAICGGMRLELSSRSVPCVHRLISTLLRGNSWYQTLRSVGALVWSLGTLRTKFLWASAFLGHWEVRTSFPFLWFLVFDGFVGSTVVFAPLWFLRRC